MPSANELDRMLADLRETPNILELVEARKTRELRELAFHVGASLVIPVFCNGQMLFCLWELGSKETDTRHAHNKNTETIGITRGVLEIVFEEGGHTTLLQEPGQTITIPPGTPHTAKALGCGEARGWCLFIPPEENYIPIKDGKCALNRLSPGCPQEDCDTCSIIHTADEPKK